MRNEKVMMVVACVVLVVVFLATFLSIGLSFVCMMHGNSWYAAGFMMLGLLFGILCVAVLGEVKDARYRGRVL